MGNKDRQETAQQAVERRERSWFKREISIGNLLTLLTMLGLAVNAYYKIEARQQAFEKAIIELTVQVARHEDKIGVLNNEQVRLNTIVEERKKSRL